MNIAIIVRKLNIKGGTQRQAVMLARDLRHRGHTVTLYTFLYSPIDCYQDELRDLNVVTFGSYPASSRLFFWKEYVAAKQLAYMIDRSTEILNPHDQVSYRVAAYFKRNIKNVPSVWMMNDMPTKTFSLMREREIHPNFHASILKKILIRMSDWFEIYRFIRIQDAITVLDDRGREWVKTYFHRNARTVRNGIDGDAFSYQEHVPPENKVKLLMNGIFFPHRRFEDGIDALKLLIDAGIDARLMIIGDYDKRQYAATVREHIGTLGLQDRVVLRGKVSEEELKIAYREHDIFLFPNHLQSWGIAVFEALASGLPAVVSRTSGAAEVLQDRENALIVDPKHPDQLARAIFDLIKNPELYRILSKNGRLLVEKKISRKNYADSMLDSFEKALENNAN